MDWITITGVRPYDGRYELELEAAPLTTREWGWIKRLSGYLPVTIGEDGFTDPELIAVLACIALRRAGKAEAREIPGVFERIVDAPFGSTITLGSDTADEEGDAGPPESSSNGNATSSGDASPTSSESSEPSLNPTGRLALDTSGSVPATSAN